MRLICPNCDAQYEVSDEAIPPEGRDVQCSNCGHGWFQRPVSLIRAEGIGAPPPFAAPQPPDAAALPSQPDEEEPAAEARPEAPALPPREDRPETVGKPDTAPRAEAPLPQTAQAETAAGPEAKPPFGAGASRPEQAEGEAARLQGASARPVPPSLPPIDEDEDDDEEEDEKTAESRRLWAGTVAPPSRSLDEGLLAVLREEAELAARQRRAEAPARPAAAPTPEPVPAVAVAPVAPWPQALPPTASPDVAATGAPDPAEPTSRPRRDLLPDIEAINSSLRSNGKRPTETAAPQAPAPRSRAPFRTGFFLMISLALILALAYAMAPRIAAEIPGAEPALRSYVTAVDEARLALDRLLRTAAERLQEADDR
ncbi:zinc-ribbon domain-containing protein [Cereibacter johrii]|uniref:zinc-ribbon domain-containing protein n=1 Tax=Cereibacter johrii TaxID=445629 RepID=UPI002B2635EA|nr:zinc-ribbon domain-containing protein [Cereibacter johrii]MEA5159843.1 zinc-ribbon domain-containing protein [Cereibacter johrii]